MTQASTTFLFAAVREAIGGKPLTTGECALCTADTWPAIRKMAQKHAVAPLVAHTVRAHQLSDDAAIQNTITLATVGYELLNHEQIRIGELLGAAEIRFIPLKGAVMRRWYTHPWMRSSSDIDILVPPDELDRAVDLLTGDGGYTYRHKGAHDVALISKGGIRVELHYALLDGGVSPAWEAALGDVWAAAAPRDNAPYWYELPDEVFYLYHVIHMAKHFLGGGCGIKPFIDLWLLDRLPDADREKRDALLKKGALFTFAESVRRQAGIWLDGDSPDGVAAQIEAYILRGGVYGSRQNQIAVQQQQVGGRLGYVLKNTWIPYNVIKFQYPVLQKHRWLTPVMQVRRWGKLIFAGHLRRVRKQLKLNQSISTDQARETARFLTEIGL